MKEIFNYKLAFLINYNNFSNQFELKENTPEEIKDLVLELILKLENKWQKNANDDFLLKKLFKYYDNNSKVKYGLLKNHKLHNEILKLQYDIFKKIVIG